MNVLIVDTSSWISYFAGKPNLDLDLALQEARVYLSPVVAAELMSGTSTAQQQTELTDFLRDLPLCKTDLNHWLEVGLLRAKARSKKLTLSTPDAHIAQCTLDLQGYLLTEDKVFKDLARITPLRLL